MIQFEKEIISYLNLPKIPIREWDEKSPFDKGVAVVRLRGNTQAYAVCRYNPDSGDTKPLITKVFGIEPFVGIDNIYVVPDYMSTIDEVSKMDLDDESKRHAQNLLAEAKELENDGVESKIPTMNDLPEWVFQEISSKDEAKAWLRAYNSRNKIKGKVPNNEDVIKMRLYSIYIDNLKKTK